LGRIVEALAKLSLVGVCAQWLETKITKMRARERKR
jgi:hypothetical protein